MELIAYIGVLIIYFNILGSGVLFLEFIRLEISGVWNSARRLSKKKKMPIDKVVEICPYCGSYLIQKSSREYTLDDRWIRKITCRACNKTWTIVYNEDQSPRQIDIAKYKKGKG